MRRERVTAVLVCFVVGLCVGGVLANGRVGGEEEIAIAVSPGTIVLGAEVPWLTVHTNLPIGAVVTDSLRLNGLSPDAIGADDRGHVYVKVRMETIAAIVQAPEATLTLAGTLKDGTAFGASETVRVIDRRN